MVLHKAASVATIIGTLLGVVTTVVAGISFYWTYFASPPPKPGDTALPATNIHSPPGAKPAVVPMLLGKNKPVNKDSWADKYISATANSNLPRSSEYSIIVVTGNADVDFEVSSKIGELYTTKGVRVMSSVLKPEFVADGIFRRFFSGDIATEANKSLFGHIDYLVLGKADVKYSDSGNYSNIEGMQKLITTKMKLSLRVLNLETGRFTKDLSLSSTGIGADEEQSSSKATDRILAELDGEL